MGELFALTSQCSYEQIGGYILGGCFALKNLTRLEISITLSAVVYVVFFLQWKW